MSPSPRRAGGEPLGYTGAVRDASQLPSGEDGGASDLPGARGGPRPGARLGELPAHARIDETLSGDTGVDGPRGELWWGDNLESLSLLARRFSGEVQCVYLDPPYNIQSGNAHYDDRKSHEAWLDFMRARLEAIRPLLRPSGLICVQIDDTEMAYLQVMMDEVFGRARRVNTITVKMSELSGVKMAHTERRLPKIKESLLVYGGGGDVRISAPQVLKSGPKFERYLRYYGKVIVDPTLPPARWEIVPIREYLRSRGEADDATAVRDFKIEEAHRVVYRTNSKLMSSLSFDTATAEVTSPTGLRYVWWEGKEMLFLSDHIHETLGDLWTDISTINLNKEGGAAFVNGKKPEALLRRIIEMCSRPGDLVLDAFAGSGTTGAVAHKLGRDWLMLESGAQCETHIAPRLRAVMSGGDRGGISRALEHTAMNGGFRGVRLLSDA